MKFLILILVVIGLPLSAYSEPSKKSDSSNKRTCRIIFPERPNDTPVVAYLYDGKATHKVRLPSASFSKVLELPSGEISIVLTEKEITDAKSIPLGAPKLAIRENVQNFYIIMSADPGNSTLPVHMRLINASDNNFSAGNTLWTNLTNHRITAKLGEQDIMIDPGGEIISKNPATVDGYYKAEFRYQPNAKGDFHKITEQHWWHDANSKHLGFIVHSGGRLPKIYFFRDFRL